MLSVHAKSFRHKSRLAISLSWVAGYTNVILLIHSGQTISHMTGNTTRLGNSLGMLLRHDHAAMADLLLFGSIIGFFFFGAVLSGWLTEGRSAPARGSLHARPITLEAILLGAVTLLLLGERWNLAHPPTLLTLALAAFAMGLQNGTITRISGAVVRTTHLTGVITDLGLELVLVWHWVRQNRLQKKPISWKDLLHQPSAQRVLLLICILGSFLLGVIIGTMLYESQGPAAMLLPLLFLTVIVLVDFFKSASADVPLWGNR
jgi:uncharacterized membrane protein YoaK (UPF0700 family)